MYRIEVELHAYRVKHINLNAEVVEVLLEGGRREEASRSSADKEDFCWR